MIHPKSTSKFLNDKKEALDHQLELLVRKILIWPDKHAKKRASQSPAVDLRSLKIEAVLENQKSLWLLNEVA